MAEPSDVPGGGLGAQQVGVGSPGGRRRILGQQCCGTCDCRETDHAIRHGRRAHCLGRVNGVPCDCTSYTEPYAACTWPGCEAPTFHALNAAAAWSKLLDHLDNDHPLCRPTQVEAWLARHPNWRPRTVYRARDAS